jgi:hypothetical protein
MADNHEPYIPNDRNGEERWAHDPERARPDSRKHRYAHDQQCWGDDVYIS